MNIVILKGRLTADPEMRTGTSGIEIANFSIAVDRQFKDKVTGERKTDFIRCTAFGKSAQFLCRYFSKGKEILAEGTLQQNNYTASDGNEVKSYQVIVNQIHFCGGKNESGTNQSDTYQPAAQPSQASTDALPDTAQFEEVLSNGEVPF